MDTNIVTLLAEVYPSAMFYCYLKYNKIDVWFFNFAHITTDIFYCFLVPVRSVFSSWVILCHLIINSSMPH